MEKKSSIIIGRLAEGREERAQSPTETNEHARMSKATTTIVAKPGGSKAWGIIQTRRKRKREEHQDRVERERLLEGDEETLLQATGKIHEYYIYDREDTNKR